ncbi:MAG: nicotinamide mononucleotide transporter [Bacteroidales bacterium]|nr:nicotinamide mononucleotide transporter [Bacteroidales bacterium]
MAGVIQAIEVFAAVTGVLYVILEILQKNSMWIVGILTGAACAFSFAVQHVWASMGLNVYYIVMSIVGLYRWKKDGAMVEAGKIHLERISLRDGVLSVVLASACAVLFTLILSRTGDPAPCLDAIAVTLSAVATWWLAMSYLQQWLLWIVADVITVILCIVTGQYLLSAMYLAYIGGAVYGYIHWKRHGKVVS